VEANYVQAVDDLEGQLAAARANLSPKTVKVVERNLANHRSGDQGVA